MIDADTRQAILLLHERGVSVREITIQLHIGRNTIRRIIRQGRQGRAGQPGADGQIAAATMPAPGSPDYFPVSGKVDMEKLGKIYLECDGWVQRIHERLIEEGVELGYSTLTRIIRQQRWGAAPDHRHDRHEDKPGAEMQHDTSPYRITIGVEKNVLVVASLLYYRYSKQRYLKFYNSFTRFQMKCFFYEALLHYKYSASICVIDNTNLAVHHGTGPDAVFVTEMDAFAKALKFKWLAHKKRQPNRKAGEERSFWTVETNFFPGRKFSSMEDLNKQAFEWSTKIMANREQTDDKIIPNQRFEEEKLHLNKIPPYVPEPYLVHERIVDQYGYISFDHNEYWVPGTGRGKIKILQYADRLRIYRDRNCLHEYARPAHGVTRKRFKPAGTPDHPEWSSREDKRSKAAALDQVEQKLRVISPAVGAFLEFAVQQKSMRGQRPRLVRELYRMSSKMSQNLFIQTIERAHRYHVTDPRAIERIATFLLRDELFDADVDETFAYDKLLGRDTYREGLLSADPDLSLYQGWLESQGGTEEVSSDSDESQKTDPPVPADEARDPNDDEDTQ